MFSLPNASHAVARHPNANVPPSDDVRIGNHSLETLLQSVRDDIHPQIERTFSTLTDSMRSHGGGISPANALMLAALESVSSAMRDYGITLNSADQLPDNIYLLVREALKLAKQSPVLAKYVVPKSIVAMIINKIDPEKVDFRLPDIRQMQRHGFNGKTSFDMIAPEHRWRMCIDPQRTAFIERHLNHISSNPLLPFIFDSDHAYLHGMLNAWSVSMQHLDHPLNSQLLNMLHSSCEPLSQVNGDGFSEQGGMFVVKIGDNMSVAGKPELLAFAQRVRTVVPTYGVASNPADHPQFLKKLATAPDREALWKEIEPLDGGMLIRSPIPGPKLKAMVEQLFANYEKRMSSSPESKLQHMVQLCQELERLHPFGDGNCRTFGVLLLNNLLARHGMPLAMLDDPNVLDGFSLAECVAKVEEGQQRVLQWNVSKSTNSQASALPRTRLQASLEAQLRGE